MLSKKSQVEDMLPLMFIITAIVIFVLIFSLINISKKNSSNEYAGVLVMEKDANQLLHNYLSSTDTADSGNQNMADAINTYFMNEDQKTLLHLNQITNDFLSNSEIETDYATWSLEIKFNGKEITLDSERAKKSQVLRREIARTIIPPYSNSGPIEIRLFEVTTKFVG